MMPVTSWPNFNMSRNYMRARCRSVDSKKWPSLLNKMASFSTKMPSIINWVGHPPCQNRPRPHQKFKWMRMRRPAQMSNWRDKAHIYTRLMRARITIKLRSWIQIRYSNGKQIYWRWLIPINITVAVTCVRAALIAKVPNGKLSRAPAFKRKQLRTRRKTPPNPIRRNKGSHRSQTELPCMPSPPLTTAHRHRSPSS